MVQTANSDIFLFLIVLLLLIPVTAGEDNFSLPVTATGSPDPRAPYTIQLFIPTQKMIHSDQINDLTSGPAGKRSSALRLASPRITGAGAPGTGTSIIYPRD